MNMRTALIAWIVTSLLVPSGAALAADADACASSYEEGQVARAEGQLRRAREALSSCTRPECADFIRADCGRWLAEVEAALPTVVLAAIADGRDVHDVRVTFDGAPLVTQLDGKSVVVEPGRHTFVFERSGETAVTIDVVISEGEKNRKLLAEFVSAKAEAAADAAPPRPAQAAPSRVLPGVLLGVAAVGAAGFTTFGLMGQSEKRELEGSCAPSCDDTSVEAVERKFLVADISLGVAVLALAGSAYFYFSAPASAEPARAARRGMAADVEVSARGATGAIRWSF